MNVFELALVGLLIAGSAFLSSTEIALFSLSRFQIRSLKDRFRIQYRRIKTMLSDPSGLLVTILITNEVINISLSSILAESISENWARFAPFTQSVTGLFGSVPEWAMQMAVSTLITTPIVLLFCELTPKVIGARTNQTLATLFASPMHALYRLFLPVRVIVYSFIRIFSRSIEGRHPSGNEDGAHVPLKEEEFLTMVEEGHREGAIQETELELIRNVFNLDDSAVEEIYTPIDLALSFPSTTTLKAALAELQNRRFSRVPVTGTSKKHIVGVLYSKDLLLLKLDTQVDLQQTTIAAVMRKPMTVQSSTRLNALFIKMKKHRMHMAIIEDTPGVAQGLVTMNDVLEALFEDIIPDEAEDAAQLSKGKVTPP